MPVPFRGSRLHRSHHRYTETEKDIHSPRTQGFWRSHIGWMLSEESFRENGANARDLYRVPELIDVWFDSVSMPVAQGGYPYANQEMFEDQ